MKRYWKESKRSILMKKPMTEKKPITKKKTLIRDLILMLVLLCIDQVSKYAARMLEPDQAYVIIDHVLEIRPIENTGGPLGILEGQTFLFVFVALVMVFCAVYMLVKSPNTSRFTPLHIALTVVISGSFGNVIDRLFQGSVTDYIYLSGIHFPVFNLSDLFVASGILVFIGLFIFKYREKDLLFLDIKQKKFREMN